MKKIVTLLDLKRHSRIMVLTDTNVAPLFLDQLLAVLPAATTTTLVLPAGEKEKNITNVQKIWQALLTAQCDRKSLVINLGGGVISDMGGFAASTYMRGIDFINIPTTLLAQVDASVGGKTAIDFAGVKNLVGTFAQPVKVIIDTDTLHTLPQRELLAGFAEVIKHGLIWDKKHFLQATVKHPTDFTKKELAAIVTRSRQIKLEVVAKDPTEQGIRKQLNFGHTVGHALEAISLNTAKPLLHGEAISIGMVAEAKISQLMGLLSEADLLAIKKSLVNAGLPVSVEITNINHILQKMKTDKKNEQGQINLTLLNGIGSAVHNQHVSENIIREAIAWTQRG